MKKFFLSNNIELFSFLKIKITNQIIIEFSIIPDIDKIIWTFITNFNKQFKRLSSKKIANHRTISHWFSMNTMLNISESLRRDGKVWNGYLSIKERTNIQYDPSFTFKNQIKVNITKRVSEDDWLFLLIWRYSTCSRPFRTILLSKINKDEWFS